MNFRVRYVARQMIWVLFAAAVYFLFSVYMPAPPVPSVAREQNGPILFWYNGAIYTIKDNGTNLQKITPAAYADPKRQIAISPGCYGSVSAGCYILVKHVLYDALGNGLPLPITDEYQWINAPAVWAPDGVTLAYMVSRQESGLRDILALNVNDLVVQKMADGVDDSVIPAWSFDCKNLTSDTCYLAYGIRTPSGQSGNRVVIKNVSTGEETVLRTISGRGTDLRWSADDNLYYGGGELGWFNAFSNAPFLEQSPATTVFVPSPTMMMAAFNTVPAPDVPPELWMIPAQESNADAAERLYIFRNHLPDGQSAPQQILWSTDGESFLAFDQGTLIHYNIQQKFAEALYRNDATDNFSSYAFSPTGNGVALVEKSIATTAPKYRLFSVSNSGEVQTLVPRGNKPIIVLAWLPEDYWKYLLPMYRNDLL